MLKIRKHKAVQSQVIAATSGKLKRPASFHIKVFGPQKPNTGGGAHFSPLHLIYFGLNTDHQWSLLFPFSSQVLVRWCYCPSPFQGISSKIRCFLTGLKQCEHSSTLSLLWVEQTRALSDPLSHHSQATQPQQKDCCTSLHLASLLACLSNSRDRTGYDRTLTRQSGLSGARVRHVTCLCFTILLELNPDHSVHTDHLVTFFLCQIRQKLNVTLGNG